MPIQRAKPVETLYEAVADYDFVLTPDAPLASAIERRVDVPQFGTFATTPRRLAAGRREAAEDRSAFLELVQRTDHDWKQLGYAVGNVLQCWEHRGARDAILEYDAYVDATTERVVELLAELGTTSQRLEEHAIEADSVAVVGEDQLTALERRVLPAAYDSIDAFTGEAFDVPPFHVFESSAAIVEAILDTVDAETAGDVAVVLDRNSRYASLVESALASAGVPYYGGPGFADRPHHRCFRRLCRTAFRGPETRIADVRPILARCGTDLAVDHDRERLHAADRSETAWLREFCAGLPGRTFDEALEIYERLCGTRLDRFRQELDALGLADAPVDRHRLDELDYYLQTYDVPVERENEGVLLADAKASGYVDRSVVFHVGLDEGWTHAAPDRPWVDTDAQFRRYLQQFQLLLQSGVEQYYLVRDVAGGEPVTPCLYLGELLDEQFERFGDLDAVVHARPGGGWRSGGSSGRNSGGGGQSGGGGERSGAGDERATVERAGSGRAGFGREPVDVEPDSIEAISNSSLKRSVNCPRDYEFDRLLDGPNRDYFVEGTLFHDFAEFYVDNPDVVDEVGSGAVVDVLLEAIEPFVSETDVPLRRRTYRLGVDTIVEYLDERGPTTDDFLTPASGWGTNAFAEAFDEPVDSPLAERWFENLELGTKGQIDLVRAPNHLLDFKSGSKTSRRDVVRQASIDPPDDAPDFQAALYLSHWRTEQPGEAIEFTFFHFLETVDDLVAGEHELEETLTTVTYYPRTFDEHVCTRAAFETLLEGWNDCQATFEDLGYEAYAEIAERLSFPETTEKAELRSSTFAEEFTDAVDDATSDGVDAETGCDQAIRVLNGVREKTFFREDLDAFEAFVEERIEDLNRYRAGEERFPVERLDGEDPNYRRVDHRDLLLEGSGDGSDRPREREDGHSVRTDERSERTDEHSERTDEHGDRTDERSERATGGRDD